VAVRLRQASATGADPIAVTDNLNFGNPEKPEIMGQIVYAIEGLGEACRALDFPVVSGNVSLYNETEGQAIPPTPTIGAVGLVPDYAKRAGYAGLKAGDALVLIGESHGELGQSLFLREILGREDGAPPPVDLAAERKNGDFVRKLIRKRGVRVVHDLSDGGLIGAAAEMALASKVGVELNATSHLHAQAFLFGEDQGRYLIATIEPEAVLEEAAKAGVHAIVCGKAGGDAFASKDLFNLPLETLRAAHEGWMPGWMG
jgi:phosphoribosylformylglycinamidine (FGAM) synthase-like enzyme